MMCSSIEAQIRTRRMQTRLKIVFENRKYRTIGAAEVRGLSSTQANKVAQLADYCVAAIMSYLAFTCV